ncbi:hypothetical protein E8E11_005536 [Didymella keratinophila]|nr:hypothetical protein E8E11_005536 [Didymella keratinophila]
MQPTVETECEEDEDEEDEEEEEEDEDEEEAGKDDNNEGNDVDVDEEKDVNEEKHEGGDLDPLKAELPPAAQAFSTFSYASDPIPPNPPVPLPLQYRHQHFPGQIPHTPSYRPQAFPQPWPVQQYYEGSPLGMRISGPQRREGSKHAQPAPQVPLQHHFHELHHVHTQAFGSAAKARPQYYAPPYETQEPRSSLPKAREDKPMRKTRSDSIVESLDRAANTSKHLSVPTHRSPRSLNFSTSEVTMNTQPQRAQTVSDTTSRSDVAASRSTTSGARAVRVPSYQYDSLDPKQIRLVKIQAEKGWKIKCEIFSVSLEHPPSYVAISYAWGDLDQKSEIVLEREITDDAGRVTIERTPYRVTTSLHGALGALRSKQCDVWVWADALCINQNDTAERTKQVQMMTDIYGKAASVAVWLGPEADHSERALELIKDIDTNESTIDRVESIIRSKSKAPALQAFVALFQREYWDRLWVVQEVFNATTTSVYCGSKRVPWKALEVASKLFFEHKDTLEHTLPASVIRKNGRSVASNSFTPSQVLVYQGPSSIPDVGTLMKLENPLLDIMRACRRKLTAKSHDKVFGILGVLPEEIRIEFIVDYELSVKDVYISVVDFVLSTSRQLDIIRESIHFPMHTGSAGLPTWCPDWSHIPDTSSLRRSLGYPSFKASGDSSAIYKPADEHRKLEVSAIYISTVRERGIAVGTLTTLADHLMAFLHWRALLLGATSENVRRNNSSSHTAFCRTLCLDQIPSEWSEPEQWVRACYYVFSSLLRERLPYLPIDEGLQLYAAGDGSVRKEDRRKFLQRHFACNMMGRCFLLTDEGQMGLGSGFMAVGDIIVVPLGCATPVLLRREGRKNEYRYVGDVYLDQLMMGEAIQQLEAKKRELHKYLLH